MPIIDHRHHWKLHYKPVPIVNGEFGNKLIFNVCIVDGCSATEVRTLEGGAVEVIDGDSVKIENGAGMLQERQLITKES